LAKCLFFIIGSIKRGYVHFGIFEIGFVLHNFMFLFAHFSVFLCFLFIFCFFQQRRRWRRRFCSFFVFFNNVAVGGDG